MQWGSWRSNACLAHSVHKEVKREEVDTKKKAKDKKKRKRGDDSDSEDDESTVAKTPFDEPP